MDTFNGSKAVYCVAAAPQGSELVAFGGAERALHVWDPRTPIGQETVRKSIGPLCGVVKDQHSNFTATSHTPFWVVN